MAKPAVNFWTQDRDGERWLINGPELLIASNRPKKKGKRKMYTNRPPKHGTKAWMSYIRGFRKKNKGTKRRKSSARRNMYSAGQIANRPRIRTVTRYVKAKLIRRRHNPGTAKRMLGGFLGLPGVEPIAGAFAGLVIPPTLMHFTASYYPDSIRTNKFGQYAIAAVNVLVPAFLIKKYLSRNIGNTMMVVGIGNLLYSIAKEFAPQIFGLSGRMGYQPMLGVYPQARAGLPAARPVPMMTSAMTSGIPSRLDAGRRF